VSVTQLAPAAPPEVTGYVEAATADRLLGWAWAPRTPGVRASVELRLGDEVIATAVADQPRPDLASNGVGDGCHAFALAIPDEYRSRAAELRVFARAGDGDAWPIGAPPAAEGLSEQTTKVLRGIETLIGSQRLMHRNLQAALTSGSKTTEEEEQQAAAALARLKDLQGTLGDQMATLERFVMRLDERLAAMDGENAPAYAPAPRKPARPRGAALWVMAFSALALIVALFGLARSLTG
jgi:hypothetical protein